MAIVGADTKLCVTCVNYDGPRIPKGSFVDYDQFSCGKCYAPHSLGVDSKPAYSCAAWVKWAVLR